MIRVFENTAQIEQEAKIRYEIPEFIMMENAANAIVEQIFSLLKNASIGDVQKNSKSKVLIVCGKGNNGADGLAVARKLHGIIDCKVLILDNMKTTEGLSQYKIAKKLGVDFTSRTNFEQCLKNSTDNDIILDCIFGTGFKGQIDVETALLIEQMNEARGIKIACDIPSGLTAFNSENPNKTFVPECVFSADVTITMGCLKQALFSDTARNYCGKIIKAELGISNADFELCADLNETKKNSSLSIKTSNYETFLLQDTDIKLPSRTGKNLKKSVHKGNFGHTVVIAGQKSGAAIIAATAALKFGSGLVTLVQTPGSNLDKFKISPELILTNTSNDSCNPENSMFTDLPKNTSCVLIGSGLGTGIEAESQIESFVYVFCNSEKTKINIKSAVLDADFFYHPKLSYFLKLLDSQCSSDTDSNKKQIILTPHPKELANICKLCGIGDFSPESASKNRFQIGQKFLELYPNLTIIMKSSVTLIACQQKEKKINFFICDKGSASLAKAGSGDVLAGLTSSLLSQGYSAQDSAITAVMSHANGSQNFDFELTPLELIRQLSLKNLAKK
ncbi:MAG: NAD(P)H-hydrate dehydratase [Treponemataceae bacterium]